MDHWHGPVEGGVGVGLLLIFKGSTSKLECIGLNGDEQTCFVICIKYIHTNIKSMNSCEIMFSRGSVLAGRSLETMHFAV